MDEDLNHQGIEHDTLDQDDKRTLAELSGILQRVKEIFTSANEGHQLGRDENAWCKDVVCRLIDLGLELQRWCFQNVHMLLLFHARNTATDITCYTDDLRLSILGIYPSLLHPRIQAL